MACKTKRVTRNGMVMSKTNVIGFEKIQTGITAGCLLAALALRAYSAPLTAGDPLPPPRTTGGFDFIRIYTARNRLLLGNEGNKSFAASALGSQQVLKARPNTPTQDALADA